MCRYLKAARSRLTGPILFQFFYACICSHLLTFETCSCAISLLEMFRMSHSFSNSSRFAGSGIKLVKPSEPPPSKVVVAETLGLKKLRQIFAAWPFFILLCTWGRGIVVFAADKSTYAINQTKLKYHLGKIYCEPCQQKFQDNNPSWVQDIFTQEGE